MKISHQQAVSIAKTITALSGHSTSTTSNKDVEQLLIQKLGSHATITKDASTQTTAVSPTRIQPMATPPTIPLRLNFIEPQPRTNSFQPLSPGGFGQTLLSDRTNFNDDFSSIPKRPPLLMRQGHHGPLYSNGKPIPHELAELSQQRQRTFLNPTEPRANELRSSL